MTQIRSFVAVDPSDSVRERLGELIRDLAACGADVRWVREANVHCTLKFFGGVEPERLDAVHAALERELAATGAFAVRARGTGLFPSWSRPRVVWVGLEPEAAGASPLSALAEQVEKSLAPLGFEPEARPFRAHLTLGRVRGNRGSRTLVQRMQARPGEDFGSFGVERVVIYRSEPGRGGSVYTPLWTIPLRL